jgi:hypothetical protein
MRPACKSRDRGVPLLYAEEAQRSGRGCSGGRSSNVLMDGDLVSAIVVRPVSSETRHASMALTRACQSPRFPPPLTFGREGGRSPRSRLGALSPPAGLLLRKRPPG